MLIYKLFTSEEGKAMTTVSIAKRNSPWQIANGIVQSCFKQDLSFFQEAA